MLLDNSIDCGPNVREVDGKLYMGLLTAVELRRRHKISEWKEVVQYGRAFRHTSTLVELPSQST